jgi:hypothetical protein
LLSFELSLKKESIPQERGRRKKERRKERKRAQRSLPYTEGQEDQTFLQNNKAYSIFQKQEQRKSRMRNKKQREKNGKN